jgi:transcriptional regulator GlxA family with amidase domain
MLQSSNTDEPAPAPACASTYSPRIMDVIAHIEANYSNAIPLRDLAAIARLSVLRLITSFRQEVGIPPHRYQCDVRVREAQALLRQGVPLATAAIEAGFFDQSHLTRHFKRVCGSTPGQYRGANSTRTASRRRPASEPTC